MGTTANKAKSRQLTAEERSFLTEFLPIMAKAITLAENNKNLGVLSVKTDNPSKVLNDSIANNYRRFVTGQTPAPWIQERPEKFVDFMQSRWAPIGAENDPKNLNANWAPNVRSLLKKIAPSELYNKLRMLNIVMQQRGGNAVQV